MKASRKDFEAVAKSLKDLKLHMEMADCDNEYAMAFRIHMNELCMIFKRSNAAFNTDRFKAAIEG